REFAEVREVLRQVPLAVLGVDVQLVGGHAARQLQQLRIEFGVEPAYRGRVRERAGLLVHRSSSQRFSRCPIPSISVRSTDPFRRNTAGSRALPTPPGVPVAMMSPGSSVTIVLR